MPALISKLAPLTSYMKKMIPKCDGNIFISNSINGSILPLITIDINDKTIAIYRVNKQKKNLSVLSFIIEVVRVVLITKGIYNNNNISDMT